MHKDAPATVVNEVSFWRATYKINENLFSTSCATSKIKSYRKLTTLFNENIFISK